MGSPQPLEVSLESGAVIRESSVFLMVTFFILLLSEWCKVINWCSVWSCLWCVKWDSKVSFYILGHRGIFWIFPLPPLLISAIVSWKSGWLCFYFICETGSLFVSLPVLKLHVDQAGPESREICLPLSVSRDCGSARSTVGKEKLGDGGLFHARVIG